jgi:hypothetical protein
MLVWASRRSISASIGAGGIVCAARRNIARPPSRSPSKTSARACFMTLDRVVCWSDIGAAGDWEKDKRKAFFFEKKNQKTFSL